MKMLKNISILFLILICASCKPKPEQPITHELLSPDGMNKIVFNVNDEGQPSYTVSHGDTVVINPSALGFIFKKNDSLAKNFTLAEAKTTSFNETWKQVWGEKQEIINNYNQLDVILEEKSEKKRKLEIQFRAFNDGVAFRYNYPSQ